MAFASLSAQWWDVGTSSGGFQSGPSQILGVAAPAPPKYGVFFFYFSGVMKRKANCNLHDAIKVN